jgi:hypothetical protein
MTTLKIDTNSKLDKIQNFCKLNSDITHLIIPYTYSYQSKDLLNDIRSYVNVLNMIHDYYNKWFPYSSLLRAHHFWLNNYLWWYLREGLTREDHIILLSKCNKRLKIYQLYSRLYKFLNVENILFESYLNKRFEKLNNSVINTKTLILNNRIIWGLLKPSQREWFINDTCL